MHSSRMRTGRSLTVCCSVLPGGGLPGPGGFSLVPEGDGLPGLGGGVLLGARGVVSAWSGGGGGGVVLLGTGGVCLVRGGSPWCRGGGMPGPGGFSLVPGGSAWSGGVLHPAGGSPCQTPHPPPVNRMTDRCKNITLAKTSFRPVKITNIL